jgi:hypothetical protein
VIDSHSINLAICCTIDNKFYVNSFQIKYQNQQIATKFIGFNLINNNEVSREKERERERFYEKLFSYNSLVN